MPDRLLPKVVSAMIDPGPSRRRSGRIRWQSHRFRSDEPADKCKHLRPLAGSEQIAQRRDQWLVRRRHRIVAQGLRSHPFEGRMFPSLRHPLPLAADEKWHEKMKAFVRVGRKCERREAGGFGRHPQLLVKLADQRRLRTLARLELAAGNSSDPASCLPAGRCAIRTRRSASTRAQATTRRSLPPLILPPARDRCSRSAGCSRGRGRAPARRDCRRRR